MKSSFESHRIPNRASFAFVPARRIEPLAVAALSHATVPPEEPLPVVDTLEQGPSEETRLALAALHEAAKGLLTAQVDQVEAWREGALEAGMILARRILERELSIDPQALMPLIDRAAASFERDEPVEIFLHPADLELLAQQDEPLPIANDAVNLRAGTTLARGEASISNRYSRVEVRVETLLESLREECLADWEPPQ